MAAQKRTPKKKPARSESPPVPEGPWDRATTADTRALLEELHRLYPDADCELDWQTPYQLLIATILSAQSTDKKVNEVTPALFAAYPGPAELAAAPVSEVEGLVQQTGFYRQKTKSIQATARILVEEHDGEVPRTLDELVRLKGVARKTANVVLGTSFGIAVGVVVDTHVKRLAYRLGLSRETKPPKVEKDLMEALPRDEWIFAAHALIWHGRRVCDARRPLCDACTLSKRCPRNGLAT